jgi:hypothetical protein
MTKPDKLGHRACVAERACAVGAPAVAVRADRLTAALALEDVDRGLGVVAHPALEGLLLVRGTGREKRGRWQTGVLRHHAQYLLPGHYFPQRQLCDMLVLV